MGKKLEQVKERLREAIDSETKTSPTNHDDMIYHKGVTQGQRNALAFCNEADYTQPPIDHLAKAETAITGARELLVKPNASEEMIFMAIRLLIEHLKERQE